MHACTIGLSIDEDIKLRRRRGMYRKESRAIYLLGRQAL